ncbi:MAG: hypothetical protein PHN78_04670, partial [Dehalococcoidales bacterium]|nr:hypothetical protein [Dehalococcoidales bacterium]
MAKFNLEQFVQTFDKIREKAIKEGRLTENPSEETMRSLLEKQPGVRKTKYGNFVAESEPTSRSAMFTKNSVDNSFGEEELKLLAQCEQALAKEKLVSVDRIVGNENSGVTVRLIVPERFVHVAYGGGNLFLPVKGKVKEPDYRIIFFADEAFQANRNKPLPEKDITIRLAMLDDGRYVKVIRNGNYIG